nr:hypothetical protein [Micromonospora tarapacensis]
MVASIRATWPPPAYARWPTRPISPPLGRRWAGARRRTLLGYVVDLCRATRAAPALELGASPRGATALLGTAKAWAWLTGRDHVVPDDVKAMARATLRHRLRLRPEAELEGVGVDAVLDMVLATVPTPR